MAAYEDEDYMGDLSKLLPPESSFNTNSALLRKGKRHLPIPPPSTKTLNRYQRKKQQQRAEDEQTLTLANSSAIPSSNIGFKLLQQMGYKPGSALGKEGQGRVEPIGLEIRRSRRGLGRESPEKEKARREAARKELTKRAEEGLEVEFGDRKKSAWRSRKVFGDYKKAEMALKQLEGVDDVPLPKNEDDEEGKPEDEEEEEVVTEEDLNLILVKLREEHFYCLYCGCQYESMESLESNCPGMEEDDH